MAIRPPEYSLKIIISNGISAVVDKRASPDYSKRFGRYIERVTRDGRVVDYGHLSVAVQELGIPVGSNPIWEEIYIGFADAQQHVTELMRGNRLRAEATPEQLRHMQEMRDSYSRGLYGGGDDGRVFVAGDMAYIQPVTDNNIRARAIGAMEMDEIGMPEDDIKIVSELTGNFSPQEMGGILLLKSMHNNGYISG